MKLPEVSRQSKPFDRIDLTLIGILVLGTFALYVRTASFEFLGFDDAMYVSMNWHVHVGLTWGNFLWALTDISSSNWHPLTGLSYLALSTLFGTKPIAFHLANAILHSINVGFFYIFLRRTTALTWQSAIAAALWGWHPERVESVAWVSELKDVLCGIFWPGCMLAYVRYSQRRGGARYALVALLMVFALLSKPMAVTLPAVLLLLDYWPLQNPLNGWRVLEKIPFALLSLGTCIAAVITQHGHGSTGTLQIFPMAIRFENALVSYVSYITTTLLPHGLAVFYPHPARIGENIPAIKWVGSGVLLLVMSVAIASQTRIRRYLVVGWFWFLVTLFPVIGLLQVGDQSMADRYSYFPSMGLVIAIVWLVNDLVMRMPSARRVAIGCGVAACTALVIATSIQLTYWRNNQTLFIRADSVTRKNYLARATIAYGDFKSLAHPAETLSLARSAVAICSVLPYPHHALAAVLQEQGMYHEAFAEYEAALKLDPFDAGLHGDFSGLLVKMGRDPDAMQQARVAIKLDPTRVEPRHNLAICLANHNQLDEAIAQWREAARFAPNDGTVHGWLAEALRLRGDRAEAIEHYRAAEAAGEHNPSWEINFAWLVATDPNSTSDELDQAISLARKVCDQTEQKNIGALDSLAAALARTGRFDDAITTATTAVADADAQHQPKLAADIRSRLNAYRQGHAYLSPATTSP
jgi:Flp pilus assembly protein TadD